VPRPKLRTPELRDHLLAVAVDLLAAEGAAGFSTRSLARAAQTSTPALYELFGDRAGLLREVFFAGFRQLRSEFGTLVPSDDPRADLVRLLAVYRRFMCENPELTALMFARPFTDFDPGPAEREASGSVRVLIVEHVRRCIDAGVLHGDETDVAHVVVALTQGLAAAEIARRLGGSRESVDRRWELGIDALLDGLAR
jgi:AcrR family transcriptional regulator